MAGGAKRGYHRRYRSLAQAETAGFAGPGVDWHRGQTANRRSDSASGGHVAGRPQTGPQREAGASRGEGGHKIRRQPMNQIVIAPLDPVVARDGRPFNAGMRMKGLGWPYPSVLAGSDRKSTRLNSSHLGISYAVFC